MMRRRASKKGAGKTLVGSRWLKVVLGDLSCGIMKDAALAKGIRLALILTLMTTRFTNAFATPLAYDDGGAESFWSDYYPNGIAVRFNPPASKWRITAVLVYGFIIDKGEKPFIVEIRDRDLSVVFRTSLSISEYFKNATLHWARIPLPNVIIRGDFYVCVYPMLDFNGTQLWNAIDNDTFPKRCFLIDCYRQGLRDWKGGHAMIRVEGEEAIDLIEIIPYSISINEDALELSFKMIASSDNVQVRATLQAGSLVEDCEVEYEEGLYRTRVEWLRLLGLKKPAKLLLSAKAINSTATLTIGLNETLFSKYLELKEENELLRVMMNSSNLELRALRNRLGKEENGIALLSSSLKEYQKMLSEETEENERLTKELSILSLLMASLAILTAFLLFLVLRQRVRLGKFTRVDENA